MHQLEQAIRAQLSYSPESGELVWKVNGRGRAKRAGAVAGTVNHHGYRVIHLGGKLLQDPTTDTHAFHGMLAIETMGNGKILTGGSRGEQQERTRKGNTM